MFLVFKSHLLKAAAHRKLLAPQDLHIKEERRLVQYWFLKLNKIVYLATLFITLAKWTYLNSKHLLNWLIKFWYTWKEWIMMVKDFKWQIKIQGRNVLVWIWVLQKLVRYNVHCQFSFSPVLLYCRFKESLISNILWVYYIFD